MIEVAVLARTFLGCELCCWRLLRPARMSLLGAGTMALLDFAAMDRPR